MRAAAISGSGFAERLNSVVETFRLFRQDIVPLCAAETPISDYVRSFAACHLQEKYAMGGPITDYSGNFIGAEHVLDLHKLILDLCERLYGSAYADPRPSTGVGAVTNLMMTLSQQGQKVVLQGADAGGHPSMGHICTRLGLETIELPYDYDALEMSPTETSEVVHQCGADFLFLAPSDILYPPRFDKLSIPAETTVIYDATQTLGLIASGTLPNPIADHPRMIILGGTHKTLPGPSSGLILTSNLEIARKIDGELSPKYLRHSQPHQMAALAACLIEHIAIGRAYGARIQAFSRRLSGEFRDLGLEVIERTGEASRTHQVFVAVPRDELEAIYQRFAHAGITLNMKPKRLFRGSGLRLGVQEIARYRWELDDLGGLAELIAAIIRNEGEEQGWRSCVLSMAERNAMRSDLLVG
jgi:glycine hydroxymethyltransferase